MYTTLLLRMIAKTKINGQWYYDWLSVHEKLTRVYPCASEILLDQYEGQLDAVVDGVHHFVSRKTILPFLRWVGERGTQIACTFLYNVERGIKADMEAARKLSRKYRWEVAFAQEYKCKLCGELLHPKAFDIDHIVELCAGGKDELENLQALCVFCHAKKTRTRR